MVIRTNFLDQLFDDIDITIRDPHQTMDQYQLSPKDVINLCGGIPLPTISNIRVDISSQYQASLNARIESDQFKVSRILDPDIGRLDNQFMWVAVPFRGQHIGTNLFINQLRAASQHNFETITLIAEAPSELDEDYQGYYFWADLGFENTEQDEFIQWAQGNNRNERTLNELMGTRDGRECWKAHGLTWVAKFHLSKNHTCWINLRNALKRKGMDIEI